jgi:hypothetical protein
MQKTYLSLVYPKSSVFLLYMGEHEKFLFTNLIARGYNQTNAPEVLCYANISLTIFEGVYCSRNTCSSRLNMQL